MADGLSALRLALAEPASNGKRMIKYKRMHRLLAEGNFLLYISEGFRNAAHSSFYDLFVWLMASLWSTGILPKQSPRAPNGKTTTANSKHRT